MPSVAATMNSIRENRSLPSVASDENSPPSAVKEKASLSPSQSFDDTKERSLQHSRVEIVRLTMFRTVCITIGFLYSTLSLFLDNLQMSSSGSNEHCRSVPVGSAKNQHEILRFLALDSINNPLQDTGSHVNP